MNKTIQKNFAAISGLFLLAQNIMIPTALAAGVSFNGYTSYSHAATSAEPIVFDKHINGTETTLTVSDKSDGFTIKSVISDLENMTVSAGKVVDNPNPTKEEIKAYVLNEAKKLGLNAREVEIIVNCESKWDSKAYNPMNSNGSNDAGLWQINSIHKNISFEDKMDYKAATKWALEKRIRDGSWSAWSCSRKLAVN